MTIRLGDIIKINVDEIYGTEYRIKCPYVEVTRFVELDGEGNVLIFMVRVSNVLNTNNGIVYYDAITAQIWLDVSEEGLTYVQVPQM